MTKKNDGGALIELSAPDVDSADGMKKAVAALTEAHNALVSREKSGRVVSEDEWAKLDEGLRELSGRMKANEDTLRANAGGLGGDEQFLIEKAALRLDTPDDMSPSQRSYFNVVALKFEELAGLAHTSAGVRAAVGMVERVARGFASPGATRQRGQGQGGHRQEHSPPPSPAPGGRPRAFCLGL
jgi:hypothetical protein